MRLALVWLLVVPACGGDDGGAGFRSSDTCGLDLVVRGGIDASLAHARDVTCLTGLASGSGVTGSLRPTAQPGGLMAVDADLPDLTRGMTGATAGELRLTTANDTWRADCDATVLEQRELGPAELGTRYRIYGAFACADPAVADGASAAVTVDGLEFLYTMTWVD